MHPELFSLVLFFFVAAFTPGPNNILASYSGFNFGLKKSVPLILGVTLGVTSMTLLVNFGLILVFKEYPIIQDILKIVGSIFLIYLAQELTLRSQQLYNLELNKMTEI